MESRGWEGRSGCDNTGEIIESVARKNAANGGVIPIAEDAVGAGPKEVDEQRARAAEHELVILVDATSRD